MDKRKVIAAYRRGFISQRECAQILGIDSLQVMGMMDEPVQEQPRLLQKQSLRR